MPDTSMPNEEKYDEAIFAAGCFWSVQAAFDKLDGVIATEVGYTGGHTQNPTYRQVCSDRTGHAEALRIIYDPNLISYQKLLAVFWDLHDPTTPNRQGPDVGSQYRSAVFYVNDAQCQAAQEMKKQLDNSGRFNKPIVTEITQASRFYRAEEYHQKYLRKKGLDSCKF